MLKELIENASAGATSAHAIAGVRGSFFDTLPIKGKKKKKKSVLVRRAPVGVAYGFSFVGEGYSFSNYITESDDSDFDSADVIAKLKTAAKDADQREDTTAFALEDEDGKLVKVWVPDDQADEFEDALENALAGDDEEEQKDIEIAEVLWDLRKDFDIVNVEWGEIPEDQEETPPPNAAGGEPGAAGGAGGDIGAEGGAGGAEGEAGGDLGTEGGGGEGEMTAEPGAEGELGAGEDTAASALTQVIQAMKADAEARKAEADAKAAEAKAEEAKYAAQMASSKVKQEEDVLDMETYNNKRKEEDNEAKRLAQLAKYKHDLAADNETENNYAEEPTAETPESEELAYRNHGPYGGGTHVSKADLGDMILAALRRR